jgi:hypothetical protein
LLKRGSAFRQDSIIELHQENQVNIGFQYKLDRFYQFLFCHGGVEIDKPAPRNATLQ